MFCGHHLPPQQWRWLFFCLWLTRSLTSSNFSFLLLVVALTLSGSKYMFRALLLSHYLLRTDLYKLFGKRASCRVSIHSCDLINFEQMIRTGCKWCLSLYGRWYAIRVTYSRTLCATWYVWIICQMRECLLLASPEHPIALGLSFGCLRCVCESAWVWVMNQSDIIRIYRRATIRRIHKTYCLVLQTLEIVNSHSFAFTFSSFHFSFFVRLFSLIVCEFSIVSSMVWPHRRITKDRIHYAIYGDMHRCVSSYSDDAIEYRNEA